MDKLQLFNGLIDVITPINSMGAVATSLDEPLSETGLDSLDLLMMAIYLGDIYGIEEQTLKSMQPVTVNDMFVFMEENKTQEPPEDVKKALERVK